jgi:cell division septum initiation protein DivIVA
MTATAPDTDRLRELEADTRQAWTAYSDRLRELTGEEYERVESESWIELQNELQRLEREREALTANPA